MTCMMTRITGVGCTMTDEQIEQFQCDLRSDLDVADDDEDVTLVRNGDNVDGYAYCDGGWRSEQWLAIIQEFCETLAGHCTGGVSSMSRDMDSGGDDHTVIDAVAGCAADAADASEALNRGVAAGMAREAALLVVAASRQPACRPEFRAAVEKALAEVYFAELNANGAPSQIAS